MPLLRHWQALIYLGLVPATCGPQAQQPYVLKTGTNEVALTFHAEDAAGHAITDLTAADLDLRDDGQPPARITLFTHHSHLPLRVAIVFDVSESMQADVTPREVARRVAQSALHDDRDQALVIAFDSQLTVQQDWTTNKDRLASAAQHVTDRRGMHEPGTAIWDSLYRTCRDHIPAQTPGQEEFGSAIILFTDGLDNLSHALPQDVIDECLQRQTAIYAFIIDKRSSMNAGQKALRTLAELTGGGVFYRQELGADVTSSILQIDNQLRDRYTLVYRPLKPKREGIFHPIKLYCPHRTAVITTRTGYFPTN
jgi:VWFA-related protein